MLLIKQHMYFIHAKAGAALGHVPTTTMLISTEAATESLNISLVVKKMVFGVSDQVLHKPGCTGGLKFRI